MRTGIHRESSNSLGDQLNEIIAKVSFGGDEVDITDITFYTRDLRFKCQRCALLCCRLGGPPLSQNDIDRVRRAGYNPVEFSEFTSTERFELPKVTQRVMRSREDGSCLFLKNGREQGTHECSIYDHRPALCRLYPFYSEMVNSSSFLLKVIPCCKGLNDPDAEVVDERFFFRHLHEAIVEILVDNPS